MRENKIKFAKKKSRKQEVKKNKKRANIKKDVGEIK